MQRLMLELPIWNAGLDLVILTGKKKISEIRNGSAFEFTVALPGARFKPLSVKFDHDPLPSITDEQIDLACTECKPLYVRIFNCVLILSSEKRSNAVNITATADGAELIVPNSEK